MNPLLHFDIATASRAPPVALAERQRVRWARLLRAAAAGSAHYRRVLAGRNPDTLALSAVPPSCKSELMHRFSAWVTDPQATLSALREFVADKHRVGEPWLDRYAVWESSGSTGEPTVFVQDAQALAVYDALESMRRSPANLLRRLFDPLYLSERVAFVGVIDGHFAGEVSMQRLRREQPWRAAQWCSFSILQPMAGLIAQLNDFAPTVLATYPTAAAQLADEPLLHIDPMEIWAGGETLTPAMRAQIEQRFGCKVRNSYGASEFLPIAWECAHGQLHVNADWVVLEPVDAQGHVVPPGVLSHSTLLTNLANHVQPIIRLDIGDAIRWHTAPCSCGCSLPTIDIQGRCDDVIHLAGRDGKTIALLPLALITVLEDEAHVLDFQLMQLGPRSLRLMIGPRNDHDAPSRARTTLNRYCLAQGAAPLRIEVTCETTLPLGRSGKRQRIVAKWPTARSRARA